MGDSLPDINVDQLTHSVNTAIHGNLPPLPPLPPPLRGCPLWGSGRGGTARGGEGAVTGYGKAVQAAASSAVSGFSGLSANSQPSFCSMPYSLQNSGSYVTPRLPSSNRTSSTPISHHDSTIPTTTIITVLPNSGSTPTTTCTDMTAATAMVITTTTTTTTVHQTATAENTMVPLISNAVASLSTACQSSFATVTLSRHVLPHQILPPSVALPRSVTAKSSMSFLPPPLVSVSEKGSILHTSPPSLPQTVCAITTQDSPVSISRSSSQSQSIVSYGSVFGLSQPQDVVSVSQGSFSVPPFQPYGIVGGQGSGTLPPSQPQSIDNQVGVSGPLSQLQVMNSAITSQGSISAPASQPQAVNIVTVSSVSPPPAPPRPPGASVAGTGPMFIMFSVRLPTPDRAVGQASRPEMVTPSSTPVPGPQQLHHLSPLPLLLPLLPPLPDLPRLPASAASFSGPVPPGTLPLPPVSASVPVQFPSSLSVLPTNPQAVHSDLLFPPLFVQQSVGACGGVSASGPAFLSSPASSVTILSCPPPPSCVSPCTSQGQVTPVCLPMAAAAAAAASVPSGVSLTAVSTGSFAVPRVPSECSSLYSQGMSIPAVHSSLTFSSPSVSNMSLTSLSACRDTVSTVSQHPISSVCESVPGCDQASTGMTSVHSPAESCSQVFTSSCTLPAVAGSCLSPAFPPPGFPPFPPVLTSPSLTRRLLLLPPVPVPASATMTSDAGFLPRLSVPPCSMNSVSGLSPAFLPSHTPGMREGGVPVPAPLCSQSMDMKKKCGPLTVSPVLSQNSVLLGVHHQTPQASDSVTLGREPVPPPLPSLSSSSVQSAPPLHQMSVTMPLSMECGGVGYREDHDGEAGKSGPEGEDRTSVNGSADSEEMELVEEVETRTGQDSEEVTVDRDGGMAGLSKEGRAAGSSSALCEGEGVQEKPASENVPPSAEKPSLRLHHPPPSYPSSTHTVSLDLCSLHPKAPRGLAYFSQHQQSCMQKMTASHQLVVQDSSILTEDVHNCCLPVPVPASSFANHQRGAAAVQVSGSQLVRILSPSSGLKNPACGHLDPVTRFSLQSPSVPQRHPCQFSTKGSHQQIARPLVPSSIGAHAGQFSVGNGSTVTSVLAPSVPTLLLPAAASVPSVSSSVPIVCSSLLHASNTVPPTPSYVPLSSCLPPSSSSVLPVCSSVLPVSNSVLLSNSVHPVPTSVLLVSASEPPALSSVSSTSASVSVLQQYPLYGSGRADVNRLPVPSMFCNHRVGSCQFPSTDSDIVTLPTCCSVHPSDLSHQVSGRPVHSQVRVVPAPPGSRADCQFSDPVQLSHHHLPPPVTTLTHYCSSFSTLRDSSPISSSSTTFHMPTAATTITTSCHFNIPQASVDSSPQQTDLPNANLYPMMTTGESVEPTPHTLLPSLGYSPPGLSNQGMSPHLFSPLGLGGFEQLPPAAPSTDHRVVVHREGCVSGSGDAAALGPTAVPSSVLDMLLLKADNTSAQKSFVETTSSIPSHRMGTEEQDAGDSREMQHQVQRVAESTSIIALRPSAVTHDTAQHGSACVGDVPMNVVMHDMTAHSNVCVGNVAPTYNVAGFPDSAAVPSASSHMALPVFTGQFCLECNKVCGEDCTHGMGRHQQVKDSVVLSRARATLPDCLYLAASAVNGHCNTTGVFAKRALNMRTEFGPLQGQLLPPAHGSERASFSQWKIFYQGFTKMLDVSDENHSNWLMFVKPASSALEHNLLAFQRGHDLMMITVKDVQPDQELCFWFAPDYGKMALGIPRPPQFCPSCSVCSLVFLHRSELRAHTKEAHPEAPHKSWTCPLCNAVFPSAGKLKEHKNSHHLKIKVHVCPTCQKTFVDARNLRAHRQIHTGLRRFGCDQCGKHFTQKAHLQSHLFTHTKLKPVQCRFCSKHFVRKSDMQQHELTHTQEKALSCQQCSRTFQKPRLLRRHVRTVHNNERNYMCERCSKTFHTKYKLTRHAPSCEKGQRLLTS